LVRLGQQPAIWVPDVATQLERLARSGVQIPGGVLEAAARVLHTAGEDRAVEDLRRLRAPTVTDPTSDELPTASGRVPSSVERRLVISDENTARLMPNGFPKPWLGVDFEAHGVAIGLASTLSFAIRWHGERPAVLWEVTGAPMSLSHDAWSTAQLSGETLWAPVQGLPDRPQ
jgi:hypothetical protein